MVKGAIRMLKGNGHETSTVDRTCEFSVRWHRSGGCFRRTAGAIDGSGRRREPRTKSRLQARLWWWPILSPRRLRVEGAHFCRATVRPPTGLLPLGLFIVLRSRRLSNCPRVLRSATCVWRHRGALRDPGFGGSLFASRSSWLSPPLVIPKSSVPSRHFLTALESHLPPSQQASRC
jgi:hypothetical protein